MAITFHPDGRIDGFSGLSMPTGSVIQTVYTLKTDSFLSTNTNRTSDPRGLEVTGSATTITPTSASNKILVMATLSAGNGGGVGEGAAFKVMRSVNGGSYTETVAYGDAVGTANRGSVGGFYDNNTIYTTDCRSIQFIDTPNTTLPVDYKIYVYLFDGNTTVYINRPHTTTQLEHITGSSSIVLMEIAS